MLTGRGMKIIFPLMTDPERKLLILCAILLMRVAPTTTVESKQILGLIADIERQMEAWNRRD